MKASKFTVSLKLCLYFYSWVNFCNYQAVNLRKCLRSFNLLHTGNSFLRKSQFLSQSIKFPAFYEPWNLRVFTNLWHFFISRARWIKAKFTATIFLKSIILPSTPTSSKQYLSFNLYYQISQALFFSLTRSTRIIFGEAYNNCFK